MGTITAGNWVGFLDKGLAPRELEATLYSAADLTAKEIASLMGVAPGTVSKRLDDARFKLGARSVRGLVLEAFKRGLIAPAMAMFLAVITFSSISPTDPMLRVRRGGTGSVVASKALRRSEWVV